MMLNFIENTKIFGMTTILLILIIFLSSCGASDESSKKSSDAPGSKSPGKNLPQKNKAPSQATTDALHELSLSTNSMESRMDTLDNGRIAELENHREIITIAYEEAEKAIEADREFAPTHNVEDDPFCNELPPYTLPYDPALNYPETDAEVGNEAWDGINGEDVTYAELAVEEMGDTLSADPGTTIEKDALAEIKRANESIKIAKTKISDTHELRDEVEKYRTDTEKQISDWDKEREDLYPECAI